MAPRKPIPAPIQCKGKARTTGKRCGRWAIPGNVVCKLHGGHGGPIGGRRATDEMHEVRRIEAVVTDEVNRQMVAQGWSLEELEAPPPRLPPPHDGPSEDQVSEEEMARFVQRSMSRAVDGAVAQFQALMAARRATDAAAPPPPTIDGEVVDRDQVAEDIARLEARPTAKRQAEAARLRQVHDGPALPAPPVTAEPPSQDSKVAGSGVAPAQTASPQARPRRITTSLGIQAGDLR